MYRNSYQRGVFTIFYSIGSKPLAQWDTFTQNGSISRFLDEDIKSSVLEICGTNVSTTYIICPKGKQLLGISMPFLVMIVKNLKKYFSFEITILDDTDQKRRFRVSNFQSTTQISGLFTVMPISLSEGWNQIQFNMADFTSRAYKKQFREVLKVKINANIRLRRIYFADRLIPEDELPPEYKLFFPLKHKDRKKEKITQDKKAESKEILNVRRASIKENIEEKRGSFIEVLQERPVTDSKSHQITAVPSGIITLVEGIVDDATEVKENNTVIRRDSIRTSQMEVSKRLSLPATSSLQQVPSKKLSITINDEPDLEKISQETLKTMQSVSNTDMIQEVKSSGLVEPTSVSAVQKLLSAVLELTEEKISEFIAPQRKLSQIQPENSANADEQRSSRLVELEIGSSALEQKSSVPIPAELTSNVLQNKSSIKGSKISFHNEVSVKQSTEKVLESLIDAEEDIQHLQVRLE